MGFTKNKRKGFNYCKWICVFRLYMLRNELLLLRSEEILIIKDKKICGGVPIIRGTRIPVTLILANIRDEVCFEDIIEDYHITLEDIRDCLEYAVNQIDLCANIECSPLYSSIEDCEFYNRGICSGVSR